jgi:hypothetical protein
MKQIHLSTEKNKKGVVSTLVNIAGKTIPTVQV